MLNDNEEDDEEDDEEDGEEEAAEALNTRYCISWQILGKSFSNCSYVRRSQADTIWERRESAIP